MFRRRGDRIEVLLAHPGGPFFARKDDGHWTIPKGQIEHAGEDLLTRGRIEFEEETGLTADPHANFIPLGTIIQKGGKIVHGWAFEGDLPSNYVCQSNQCRVEWPPRSGKIQLFPEVDRVEFFAINRARQKLKATQEPFLDRLVAAMRK